MFHAFKVCGELCVLFCSSLSGDSRFTRLSTGDVFQIGKAMMAEETACQVIEKDETLVVLR